MSILWSDDDYTWTEKAFSILEEKYEPRGSVGDVHHFWAEKPSYMALIPVTMAIEAKAIRVNYDWDNQIVEVTRLKD